MNEYKKDIDELIDTIKDTDIYKNYLHIEEQLKKSEDANNLINEIKKLQKEAVKEEQINNNGKVMELDNIINTKLEALNSIPLYVDYIEASEEVSNLIQTVRKQIQDYLDSLDI